MSDKFGVIEPVFWGDDTPGAAKCGLSREGHRYRVA